jgi:hypothetical protein
MVDDLDTAGVNTMLRGIVKLQATIVDVDKGVDVSLVPVQSQ